MKTTRLIPVLLALASSAFAQNNPPAAAPATAAPAVQPADPARLALAHEAIVAMHADKIFDQIGAQIQQSVARIPGLIPPNATPEQKARIEKVMQQVMALSMDSAKEILPKMDAVYAEVFTDTELQALKTFYESPAGTSLLEKQPQVMQHLMPMIIQMQRDLQPKIRQVIMEARAEEKAAAAAAATPAVSATTPAIPAAPAAKP